MLSDIQRINHYSGIGSSSAPAALGLDQWCSEYELFCRLTDESFRPDLDGNTRIRLGNLFEPAICQASAEHWQLKLAEPDPQHTYRHADYPWILCHPDRLVVGENAVVEAKFRGAHMRRLYENDEPLDSELVQCHHQMLAGGFDRVYLAIVIGNEDERHFCIERSEPELDYLRQYLILWWHRHVVERVPPAASTLDDVKRKWPRTLPGKVQEVAAGTAQCIAKYRQLAEQIKELEHHRDALHVRISEAAGDAETLTHEGECIATYKEIVRRSLDISRLREAMPETVKQFEQSKTIRVLRPRI
jgi:predicted phage-related endonuclease